MTAIPDPGSDDFHADPHHDPSAAWAAGDDHARGADGPPAAAAPRHDPECIYCEHGPWCLTCPPPPVVDGKVCGPCREAITRSEISADPYYSGGGTPMTTDPKVCMTLEPNLAGYGQHMITVERGNGDSVQCIILTDLELTQLECLLANHKDMLAMGAATTGITFTDPTGRSGDSPVPGTPEDHPMTETTAARHCCCAAENGQEDHCRECHGEGEERGVSEANREDLALEREWPES